MLEIAENLDGELLGLAPQNFNNFFTFPCNSSYGTHFVLFLVVLPPLDHFPTFQWISFHMYWVYKTIIYALVVDIYCVKVIYEFLRDLISFVVVTRRT